MANMFLIGGLIGVCAGVFFSYVFRVKRVIVEAPRNSLRDTLTDICVDDLIAACKKE